MRIAFFVTSFPVISETFILRQITGLLDLGHKVDVYAEWPTENACTHADVRQYNLLDRTTYVSKNIPPASGYWEMPVWPITGKTWLPGEEKPLLNAERMLQALPVLCRSLLAAPRLTLAALSTREYGIQAASLSTLYRLAFLASRFKRYDILHAHFGPIGNTFRFAKMLWERPLIVTFHGYDLCTVPRLEGAGVYRRLFREVDAVTAHSAYAHRLLERLGCSPMKLHRLHMGVNTIDFPYCARSPDPHGVIRLLTVARLVEIKGLEYSIVAVARVLETHPSLRYDIIGEGNQRPKLEKLIGELGLEKVVTLHGARNGGDVREFMARAHLFVLPSVNLHGDEEGVPVSLMEAQASGIPVLASRTGGIPEVVLDGQSGFLFPERDVGTLAAQICHLLENPEVWPEMGRLGRRHIEENYSSEKLTRQLAGLYQKVIAGFRAEKRR